MIHNIITPKAKVVRAFPEEDYKYLMAVSTDSLYILSSDKDRIVETIVEGKDNDAWMFSSDCQDDFLDAINIIKDDILSGVNPLIWLL
jgi:hypothetical protein